MVRSNLSLRKARLRWTPPAAIEIGDSFADRSPPPPGMGTSNMSQRCSPLRWAPQQPSKVATVSQIAAPQDVEVSR